MQAVARLSSSSSKRAVISKEALKSNILSQCKSYATSVKDQSVKLEKAPKRVSKQERRRAIASFVEKYIASNEGRFPNISLVNKEVGGSYYITREIVQELEYKYKLKELSGTATDEVPIETSINTAINTDKDLKELLSGAATDEQNHAVASTIVEVPINTDKEQPSLKAKKIKKGARKVETGTQTLQEISVEAEKIKMGDEIPEPENVPEKPNSNEHDQYSSTEGSIWGNLKSFSDKIISLWKKL